MFVFLVFLTAVPLLSSRRWSARRSVRSSRGGDNVLSPGMGSGAGKGAKLKTRSFVAAVAAGAALGVGGLSTVASALQYRVSPGLTGGHVRPSAVVYDSPGEYEYWRKGVSTDVTAHQVSVQYEAYDTSYGSTTQEIDDVSVSRTGVRRRTTWNYWGYDTETSYEDTFVTIEPATGVTVGDFMTGGGCTSGTGVRARPLHSLQPEMIDVNDC